jgi:hypothetical protein
MGEPCAGGLLRPANDNLLSTSNPNLTSSTCSVMGRGLPLAI